MGKDNTLTVRHIYIPAMVNEVELWLKQKSLEGLRLQGCILFSFRFEKCAAREREYFICSHFDNSKGISFDYHMAKQKYKCAKSHLNKGANTIFEADLGKIDGEYHRTKRLRNEYYLRHYLLLSIFFLPILLAGLWLAAANNGFVIFLLPCAAPFFYALVSFLIIRRTAHKKQINTEKRYKS